MRVLKLEIRKILKTRRTLVFIALSLFLTVWMAYLPVTFEEITVYDEAGNKTRLQGREAVPYIKEVQKEITGTVTPEKVKMALTAYQDCLREYDVEGTWDLPEGVYEERILPYDSLLRGAREAFANRENGMAPAYMEIQPEWIDNYYPACEERLASLMGMEQKNNPAAQEIALKMYEEVEKPYLYYPGYNSNAMEYVGFLAMLLMFFSICIAAPVFSSDYQTGADDILRCTKHGRLRLGISKMITAIGITGILFAVCMPLHLLLSNTFFGWECIKTSIQIEWSVTNLVNWNMGKLQCAVVLAGLLTLIASVCATLFLSSRCRNVVSAMAVSFGVCMLPMLLYLLLGGTSKLGLWLKCLLPSGGLCVPTSFLYEVLDYQFLKLGDFTVWVPYAILCFAGVEALAFAALSVYSYIRHSVK